MQTITYRQKDGKTYRGRDTDTQRQAYRHTHRHTMIQLHVLMTDRQTDRDIHTDTQRYSCMYWCISQSVKIFTSIVPDFCSGSCKSGIRPFFGNPAKSSSGQISSRICQMPVQLQYVQLMTDKTNTADLSSGLFTILICAIWMKITKFIAVPQILSKPVREEIKEALNCTASL